MYAGPCPHLPEFILSDNKVVDTCNVSATIVFDDSQLRHKGLQRFFSTGSTAGIQAHHAKRLRLILGRLDVATQIRDMDLPGLRLHALIGNRKGAWSFTVSGNWRVTFRLQHGDAEIVDYEDYH